MAGTALAFFLMVAINQIFPFRDNRRCKGRNFYEMIAEV
jgi:hypothetical protein